MTAPTFHEANVIRAYQGLLIANGLDVANVALVAWATGYKAAVADYGVWNDGEQRIGVQAVRCGAVCDEIDRAVAMLVVDHLDADELAKACGVDIAAAVRDAANPCPAELTHRSRWVSGEVHLGNREDCRHCDVGNVTGEPVPPPDDIEAGDLLAIDGPAPSREPGDIERDGPDDEPDGGPWVDHAAAFEPGVRHEGAVEDCARCDATPEGHYDDEAGR